MIRTEGVKEGNRRGLDTSWLRKGIRDQALPNTESLKDYLQQMGSIFC